MPVVVGIGARLYEFNDRIDAAKCFDIFAAHSGDQNSLETKFEDASIDFNYESIDFGLAYV